MLQRADSLMQGESFEAASEAFNDVLKKDPSSIHALKGLGMIAIAKEDYRDARGWFREILSLDASNIEAHYYYGLSCRESVRSEQWVRLDRDSDETRAWEHLSWVAARDSMYSDIVYQIGLFALELRQDYPEAIRLGRLQVLLKPADPSVQFELFSLYRAFLVGAKRSVVSEWLKQQPTEYAVCFLGELLRRNGQLLEADSVFQKLLQVRTEIPLQPVYLSLARIHYELNQPEDAEGYYWLAVNEASSHLGIMFLFNDLKYIVSDPELAMFTSMKTLREKIDFFQMFWTARNPVPAASTNARLSEHYKRLLYAEKNFEYYGLRNWTTSADKFHELQLPKAYFLNREFNDKGLVYVRQGAPDHIEYPAAQTSLMSDNDYTSSLVGPVHDLEFQGRNESWIYERTDEGPEMILHFIQDHTLANNWRLAPLPTDRSLMQNLAAYDSRYFRLLNQSTLEAG